MRGGNWVEVNMGKIVHPTSLSTTDGNRYKLGNISLLLKWLVTGEQEIERKDGGVSAVTFVVRLSMKSPSPPSTHPPLMTDGSRGLSSGRICTVIYALFCCRFATARFKSDWHKVVIYWFTPSLPPLVTSWILSTIQGHFLFFWISFLHRLFRIKGWWYQYFHWTAYM